MEDPLRRFGRRAEDYAAARPGYPRALTQALIERGHLARGGTVADVGCGTGLLSRLFLDAGCRVLGVEPNAPMREAARRILASDEAFHPVDGRAERTTLDDASVDLIAAGQAFHWFDPDAARAEFARILRPGGSVVLVWNVRRDDAGAFMRDYERLLRGHILPGESVGPRCPDEETLSRWFGEAPDVITARHAQQLDLAGLEGRLASSSYLPARGDPGHKALRGAMNALFDRHARDGAVVMEYEMRAWAGRLGR